MLRKNLHIGLIGMITLLWVACTTEKNTFLTRAFHNTTCRFNGYFWGNLSYEEGLQKLAETHQEDFTSRLPVFVYADDKEAPAIYPQMDRAIKKATTMIENHTITNKQKREVPDAVKYIKYCYLLLAKARISKNEYLTAIEALDYAAKEYRKTGVKYEAIMWEARAYNQIGAVSKSVELVDLIKSSKSLPKSLYADVYATVADYYSRTGQDDEEEKWLKKAVEKEKKRKVKARYYFILAQISEESHDPKTAFALYSKVLRNHPSYDLDFEANIKKALLFLGDAKENENIIKQLNKMLKPTKNSDNKDQIYYALASISEKEGDTAQAMKYLIKSVRSSTTNTRQKAISFLALADLNFYKTEYVMAKRYYDSTLASLPKNYKGRDSIVDKKNNLQKLVKYLDMINLEDSVLRLSKMDAKELNKYIDNMIAQAKADADKKKQEAALAAENQSNGQPANPNNPVIPVTNGKWYFYNPGQIQLGLNEFTQKWGNRILEDNWRRSKKPAEAQQNVANNDASKKGDSIKTNSRSKGKDSSNNVNSRAYYLKNIPKGDAQIKAANDSLIEAYYNVGSIYKEYLKNDAKAAADFEDLLKRYPENKYQLTVYYQLYRIYLETGNTERMNIYKNIILTKYPNTEYAQLIVNPEKYQENQKASKQEMERLYTATLESYETAKYTQVLDNCHRADSLYPKNPLSPKFAYLEAVATGYTQGLDAYKNALTKVMILYPKDSVKQLAQTTLEYLNKKIIPAKDTGLNYTTDDDTVYYWDAIIDNKESAKVNDFRSALANANAQTFSQNSLQMDNLLLNPNQQLILIRKFKTKDEAKNYYGFMANNTVMYKNLSPGSYQTFYISNKNFHIMFNHKKADEYVKFFKDKGL